MRPRSKHAAGLVPRQRAELQECLSYEAYSTGRIRQALEARRAALVIWNPAGDALRRG